LPAEVQVGRLDGWLLNDRIRLTDLLRKSPAPAGFFYGPTRWELDTLGTKPKFAGQSQWNRSARAPGNTPETLHVPRTEASRPPALVDRLLGLGVGACRCRRLCGGRRLGLESPPLVIARFRPTRRGQRSCALRCRDRGGGNKMLVDALEQTPGLGCPGES
jgi:hypothetical protein